MSRAKRMFGRVNAFFHKPQLDADLQEELAAHLEMADVPIVDKGASGNGKVYV